MRTVVVSAVGASVSFFVPGVGPAVQQAVVLQPAVQPAEFLQPQLQPEFLAPQLRLPEVYSSAPQMVAIPSARPAENDDGSVRWFAYGLCGALFTMALRSQLQPAVASLATSGRRAAPAAFRLRRGRRAGALQMAETPPPEGFVWAEDAADAAPAADVEAPSAAGEAATTATAAAPETAVQGVVVPTAAAKPKPAKKAPKAPKAPKREAWKEGIFAPAVLAAKQVMGEQKLKEVRAAVIAKHSRVIQEFVDTSESKFGQLVLQRMFEYADKDGNGTLDKEEVRAALMDLGFDFLDETKVDKLVQNADKDQNDVIDFEEFCTSTPKLLRTNLVKLAKKNGHDLGFLV